MKIEHLTMTAPCWQLTLTAEEMQLVLLGLKRQIAFDDGALLKRANTLADHIVHSEAWSGVKFQESRTVVIRILCAEYGLEMEEDHEHSTVRIIRNVL